jgi:glucose-6-phosphate isomerase
MTHGKEYVKTAGYYHPKAPKADVSYTEIYKVLEESAIYLLQKAGSKGRVLDIVLSRLKRIYGLYPS